MRLSWIKMVDCLSAEPEKYPPGAADAMAKDVPGQLIPLGRSLLDDGRMRDARELFAKSLKHRFSKRAAVLWALSFLNLTNFNRLLVAKRRIKVRVSR
jgi:hypothetical protein